MKPGLFISFEGIDGAGKTTHIQNLAQTFRNSGHVVTLTREPGGTTLAEQLRELILHADMDSLTEALMINAARRDHINKVIGPAIARGEVVISDRFTDATFAYQGAGRGFDLEILLTLENWVQADDQGRLFEPDLTIWFDLPADVAAKRLVNARLPDRFESQPTAFFDLVRSGYASRMMAAPHRFAQIDARQSIGQVGNAVMDAVISKGWLSCKP